MNHLRRSCYAARKYSPRCHIRDGAPRTPTAASRPQSCQDTMRQSHHKAPRSNPAPALHLLQQRTSLDYRTRPNHLRGEFVRWSERFGTGEACKVLRFEPSFLRHTFQSHHPPNSKRRRCCSQEGHLYDSQGPHDGGPRHVSPSHSSSRHGSLIIVSDASFAFFSSMVVRSRPSAEYAITYSTSTVAPGDNSRSNPHSHRAIRMFPGTRFP